MLVTLRGERVKQPAVGRCIFLLASMLKTDPQQTKLKNSKSVLSDLIYDTQA